MALLESGITIKCELEGLEEACEKLNQLNILLKETECLIGSLSKTFGNVTINMNAELDEARRI